MFKKQKKEKRQFLVYYTTHNTKGNAEIITDEKFTLDNIRTIKEHIVKDCGVDFGSIIIENIMEIK